MIFIKHTYPLLSRWIERIPNRLGKILTWVFIVFMIFNMLISGLAVRRWTNRSLGQPPANAVSALLDRLYPDEFMRIIYPNMSVVDEGAGDPSGT